MSGPTRELAVLNARRARFLMPDEFPQAGIHCPLRSEDGHCLTFLSRPLACRSLCSACPCPGDGSCTEQLQMGMADGLSEGLRQEGLDGDTYELNDALATALATPHAAARWSRGEAVFANCAKV